MKQQSSNTFSGSIDSLPQLGKACVSLPWRNRHRSLSQRVQMNTHGLVTAEETRQELEFNMEKSVREYLRRASQALMMRDMVKGYYRFSSSLFQYLRAYEGFWFEAVVIKGPQEFRASIGIKVFAERLDSRLRHKKGRQYIIKRMIGSKEKRLHGLKTWLLRVELRETCLRSIEVEHVKLTRWMKPDELYSECVRLRRSVLKRLQGDAEVEQVCSGSRKCRHKEIVMDLD
ncbi:hypothetical protein F2Q68_00008908 [Brassica cretica]|uniref:Uncharacterized protein n=1 Tax=Brassica cretica TaxID=69181 RepID=A0A8S9KVU6_BRACR|nr:hypothetical protein F2Q68_00008908 [Brassica cretica]